MRIALGLDADNASAFAAVVDVDDPQRRSRSVSGTATLRADRPSTVVSAAQDAIELVSAREGVAPTIVTVVRPISWDVDQVTHLERALRRGGLERVRVISSILAAAMADDARTSVPEGDVLTIVEFGAGRVDVQALRKVGVSTFLEVRHPMTAPGIPEAELDETMLRAVGARLPSMTESDPSERDAVRTALRAAREQLCYETSAIIGTRLPGLPGLARLERDTFESALAIAAEESLPPILAAVLSATVGVGSLGSILLVGTDGPIPLLARLIQESLEVPVAIADRRHGPAVAGALFGAAIVSDASAPTTGLIPLPPLEVADATHLVELDGVLEPVLVEATAVDAAAMDAADPVEADLPSTRWGLRSVLGMTIRRSEPLTLLRLWPITLAAALLVALAGTAASGAFDPIPASDKPHTVLTDQPHAVETPTPAATTVTESPTTAPVSTAPVPAPTTAVPPKTTKKKTPTLVAPPSDPQPPVEPQPPVTPVTPQPTATPTPTPVPTDTPTPAP